MYIETPIKKQGNKTYSQVLLRESYRGDDGKVKKRTIANLTKMPIEQVLSIKQGLKGNHCINPNELQQGKSVGFSLVVYFIMKLLGILKILGKNFEAKIAIVLIVARVILQSSRLQALYWAKDEDKILDIANFTKDEKNNLNDKTIYKGLDYLYDNKEKIEDKLFKLNYKNKKPKKVYYDVTSSYVEGDYEHSQLVKYGYNRDGKKGKQQVVVGLLTDEHGKAISIDTYKGNTNDVKTFADQLNKLKQRFELDNITVVGDGGMIKNEEIEKVKEYGYDYITTIGKPSIEKLINDKTSKMNISLFDENIQEVIEYDETKKENVRYIVKQNPIRANEIRKNREDKLSYLKKFIDKKVNYYNTHYKAKQETLEKYIKEKINKLKLSSFIDFKIIYKDSELEVVSKEGNVTIKTKPIATIELTIDSQKQNQVQKLDGCYVIKTSLTNINKNTKEEIHASYKNLIKVENAFKTLKTDYLEIRPLYLKTDKRIKGHVFLSMLAYNIVWELKKYINLAQLDFKSTIRKIKNIVTVKASLSKQVTLEYIPKPPDDLLSLFKFMKFSLPTKFS